MNLSLTAQALSRQEIFDKAYRGLEAQGFEKSFGEYGRCAYRGSEERRCAAGFIIPDDRYDPSMEGLGADNVVEIFHLRDIVAYSEDIFIWSLQLCHDRTSTPEEMQNCLREFAREYALTIPAAEASL